MSTIDDIRGLKVNYWRNSTYTNTLFLFMYRVPTIGGQRTAADTFSLLPLTNQTTTEARSCFRRRILAQLDKKMPWSYKLVLIAARHRTPPWVAQIQLALYPVSIRLMLMWSDYPFIGPKYVYKAYLQNIFQLVRIILFSWNFFNSRVCV